MVDRSKLFTLPVARATGRGLKHCKNLSLTTRLINHMGQLTTSIGELIDLFTSEVGNQAWVVIMCTHNSGKRIISTVHFLLTRQCLLEQEVILSEEQQVRGWKAKDHLPSAKAWGE